MYCNHLARIDSSIKPRHLIQMIIPSFVLLLLYIGFCHSRGTGVAGLDNVRSGRFNDGSPTHNIYLTVPYMKMVLHTLP